MPFLTAYPPGRAPSKLTEMIRLTLQCPGTKVWITSQPTHGPRHTYELLYDAQKAYLRKYGLTLKCELDLVKRGLHVWLVRKVARPRTPLQGG